MRKDKARVKARKRDRETEREHRGWYKRMRGRDTANTSILVLTSSITISICSYSFFPKRQLFRGNVTSGGKQIDILLPDNSTSVDTTWEEMPLHSDMHLVETTTLG